MSELNVHPGFRQVSRVSREQCVCDGVCCECYSFCVQCIDYTLLQKLITSIDSLPFLYLKTELFGPYSFLEQLYMSLLLLYRRLSASSSHSDITFAKYVGVMSSSDGH